MILPACRLFGLSAELRRVARQEQRIDESEAYSGTGVLLRIPEMPTINWDDESLLVNIPEETPIAAFCPTDAELFDDRSADYSHWLSLAAAPRQKPLSALVSRTILRAAAYCAAYPHRITNQSQAENAALLFDLAGSKRSPFALRLRRAGNAFESGDVTEGIIHLREAALVDIQLPSTVRSALLLREDDNASPMQIRELNYLARAGTLDMKILALSVLRNENESADVSNTLSQLAYDPHPWVRATVKGALLQSQNP